MPTLRKDRHNQPSSTSRNGWGAGSTSDRHAMEQAKEEQHFGGTFSCTQTHSACSFSTAISTRYMKCGPQNKCLMQLPLSPDGVGPASMAVGITLLGHSSCDVNLRPNIAMWKGKPPFNIPSGEHYSISICPSGPVALISARPLAA